MVGPTAHQQPRIVSVCETSNRSIAAGQTNISRYCLPNPTQWGSAAVVLSSIHTVPGTGGPCCKASPSCMMHQRPRNVA